jgi:hypothetical protein
MFPCAEMYAIWVESNPVVAGRRIGGQWVHVEI